MEGVWHEADTTPAAIEAALRELLKHQHEKGEAYAPARVLNLLVVADREWRGEIQNRLENVGRNHPSRTILCAVEPGRTTIDAWATMIVQGDPRPGELAVCHEHLVVDVGPQHLPHLDTIVAPLLATDIATLLWSPHGHPEAVDALLHLAQVVLIDSVNEPDPASGDRPREDAGGAGLRRRSRLAALHALAGADREHVRPAELARRAAPDHCGDGAAQPGVGDGRAAVPGLAGDPSGLGAGTP